MARKSSTVPLVAEQTTSIKHYGFAIIPRIVIRGEKYKDMSLIERGLYQGIKDICGEEGECFFILRNLAKELHTSISTLSRYIPVLANKWGLITAEKKCRGNGTNKHEIFHIRIVSVWEENDALYKPQDCFNEKQSSVSDRNKVNGEGKTVSDRNNFVSDRNNFVSDRNSIESSQAQDCFYLNDRMISINNTLSEEEHNYVVAHANDDTPIFSFPVIDSEITQVSDESFKVAVLDDWKVYRPSQKITTSSQSLEQILNRLSTGGATTQLSTPAPDLSPESVDNSGQGVEETSAPPQASVQSYSRETTQQETQSPDSSGEDAPPSEKPARPPRQRKPVQPKPVKPEMPPEDAQWPSEETAVQIIEAVKGRRYGDTTRAQEKTEAKKVLKLYYGDEMITRKQFEQSIDDMFSWAFWKEHTNVKPMIKTLRKDDKILNILDDLEKKDKRRNGHPAKSDRVNAKNANRATQSYAPEDYAPDEKQEKEIDEYLATHQIGA